MANFDEAKAKRAVSFMSSLKHTKGKWRGVNFELLPWQDKIISDVFGTVKDDEFRLYNTAYIEVPKKNGKSEIAAAVALYLTCADNEWGAEVYGCAADRQQASIVFDVAVDMVDQCPALKKRIKPILSQKRLVYLPFKSFYQVLSAEAFSKHGLNVHGVVFDELHAQPNRDLYDVMTKGSGDARTQPLFFVITTAGDDPDQQSIGWEVHQKAVDVLSGVKDIPNFYSTIYGLSEDDDWKDEKNWLKSNPSLGHTIQLDTVRAAFKDINNEADERAFRQLRLNQWVKTKFSKWVSLDVWDRNSGVIVHEALQGRKCYGGLDLSSKLDITAFVLIFPPEDIDEKYTILPYFWIPEDNMRDRVKRDKVCYDRWVRNNLIKTTPGNVIDYQFIKKEVNDLKNLYDIQEIGYDPWNAMQTAVELTDDGLVMVEVRQGYKSMSPPMKELEAFLVGEHINHGNNPVLRWMFGNLEIKKDENDNIRPIKGKAIERIDGVVALINAMSRLILQENTTSVYEERGIMYS